MKLENLSNTELIPSTWKSVKITCAIVGFLSSLVLALVVGVSLPGTSSAGVFNVSGASRTLQDELRIQLGNSGFMPSEVQHAPGTFPITVENSAISGEYTLRLKAADGTVLKEVQVQKGSAGWTMTLATGEYTLTETSHPQWSCRITVQ
jgi:hypothetical protein